MQLHLSCSRVRSNCFLCGAGKIELEDFILEVKAIIARPPLLASTTLQDLGQNAKRQRTKIALSSSALNVKWDDKLWEYVAVSTGLPEKDDGDRDGLQSIFTRLMKAPPPTRLSSCTMSIDAVLCVEMTSSLILMSLRHKPMVPMTTRLVLHLKHQDSQCDSSKNIGKAITYGRMCLQQLPRTLRSTVLVGLTDLQTITLIRVTLPMQPDQEASPSVQVSEACPDVRDTLLQLLSSHPSDLQVNMPDLGPPFVPTFASDQFASEHSANIYAAL